MVFLLPAPGVAEMFELCAKYYVIKSYIKVPGDNCVITADD